MRREALRRKPREPDHREFVSGFIRLHILHHAAQEPLVGFWMIEELRRHGYEMSPGTIYPLLHSLQKKGYLSVEVKREGRRSWREYSATKEGNDSIPAASRVSLYNSTAENSLSDTIFVQRSYEHVLVSL